jgi:hypothetical protein
MNLSELSPCLGKLVTLITRDEKTKSAFDHLFWYDMSTFTAHIGKASGLDYSWPDKIYHQKPELSACCLVMYVNCNLTDQMWSKYLFFPHRELWFNV